MTKKCGFINLDFIDTDCIEWLPKIRTFIRRTKLEDGEDLVQEMMLHLFEISKKYKYGQNTFRTFAWTCLKNKLRTIIRQTSSQQELKYKVGWEPQQFFWNEIEFDVDKQRVLKDLNIKQTVVLEDLECGYKKNEIASRLSVSESRISSILIELQKKVLVKELLNASDYLGAIS